MGLAFAQTAWAAATSSNDRQVVISVQGLPLPGETSVVATAYRTVLKAFLEEYPAYKVEPFVMPDVAGLGMDTGPLMAIAAGTPPHAIYVNFRQSSSYIAQGFVEPMESLLARILSDDERVRRTDAAGGWLADPTEREIAHALELIRQRVAGPVWPVVYRVDDTRPESGRHVWAIPINTFVMALLYRKDLFFEAGLDPDRPPTTWEEFRQYAKTLTRGRQYGLMLFRVPISWSIYSFLVSNGAQVLEQATDGSWRAIYDTRAAAEAIYYVWQLVSGDKSVSLSAAELEWQRGEIAMRFNYLDDEQLSGINPQLVGIAPVPLSPLGARNSELNCRMLGVFSDSTPEQKLAVMRYIWFTTGERAQQIRTRVLVENGFGRFVNPDLLRKFGYEHALRQVPEGWRETFGIALANGIPEPYGRNTQNIYRYMAEPIDAALELPLGDLPREDALDVIESLLRESAREVNTKVLGHLTAQEMRKRRIIGGAVLALVLLGFAVSLGRVWRSFSRGSAAAIENPRWRKFIWGYILLVPALVLLVLWHYVPLVGGLGISLTDYQLVRDSTIVFVDNFANVLFDEKVWAALGRTFYFVALMLGLGFWPPIALAILLQEVLTSTAKYVYRTIFYLPAVVSGVLMMFLWKQLYAPTSDGVLNQLLLSLNSLGPLSATLLKWFLLGVWLSLIGLLIWLPIKLREVSWRLRLSLWMVAAALVGVTVWPLAEAYLGPSALEVQARGLDPANVGGLGALLASLAHLVGPFGLEPLGWIQSPRMAMLCVVIPFVWASMGPGCILYLAALKTVPDELYEAADIDGAGIWNKLFYITLPTLKYLIAIQFIFAVIMAFRGGTDMILALTGGGPSNATQILALEIFFRTFLELKFGIGAAMAWLLGGLLIGLTAQQLKMLSRAEFRTAARTDG